MQLTNQDENDQSTQVSELRHAIRNDVSVIIAFAQLVKINPNDPKAPEFLKKIESRSKMILSTLESYLNKEMAAKRTDR